jgi:hypothetical protein
MHLFLLNQELVIIFLCPTFAMIDFGEPIMLYFMVTTQA